ncbi:MAG: winged helix-turn-helix domain-containing protein [Candidatus Thermoplasmatota archaeon]|jgi:predicted transcriptional regulator|nr:winged helix-turn-helix domain-containing protein [Candidatus Thermoplasmatota archaeon]
MRAEKRLLWWILAGSAGGFNRTRILNELIQTPRNANELSTLLDLDYKTTRHHLDILEKNRLISTIGNKYGTMYFPSDLLEANMHFFKEIWGKVNKNEIKKNYRKGEEK